MQITFCILLKLRQSINDISSFKHGGGDALTRVSSVRKYVVRYEKRVSSRRLPYKVLLTNFFYPRVTNGSLGLLLGVRSHLHYEYGRVYRALSLWWSGRSTDNVDNIDNKIDVNVDSNVANFWGLRICIGRATPELRGHLKNGTSWKQQSEEQAPPKAQALGELEPEEKQVKTGDWERLKRAWTSADQSEKVSVQASEVAQITTSMKKRSR